MAAPTTFRHPYAKQASAFAILVGIVMLAIWAYLILTGNVVSLEDSALGTWLHVAGEIATAVVLIIAGWGLAAGKRWSERVFILANGMLLIAVIHAIAWYGDRGQMTFVIFFVLVAIAAVFFVIRAEE